MSRIYLMGDAVVSGITSVRIGKEQLSIERIGKYNEAQHYLNRRNSARCVEGDFSRVLDIARKGLDTIQQLQEAALEAEVVPFDDEKAVYVAIGMISGKEGSFIVLEDSVAFSKFLRPDMSFEYRAAKDKYDKIFKVLSMTSNTIRQMVNG